MRGKGTGLDAVEGSRALPELLAGSLLRLISGRVPSFVRSARGVVCLTLLGILPMVPGRSQVPQYNGGLPGVERSASGFPGLPENANPRPDGVRALRDSLNQQDNQKRVKELNVQRQKEMNVDTGKLITLANEVKAETNKPVASGSKETLSVLDLHKVEMIEKLAKSVREKMTASMSTSSPLTPN